MRVRQSIMTAYQSARTLLGPAGVVLGALTMAACATPAGDDENIGASVAESLPPPLLPSAVAPLPGSTFEGNDGDLSAEGGGTDWVNAPNLAPPGIDKPSGTSDNAFGQGTKEDATSVMVVLGSIPPNKNDLTRFYVASEFANGSNFLYLAWERLVNIGSANLDFEINQVKPQFDTNTTGNVNLVRTAGDILITYDFGGSGTPTLGLLTWVTTGSGSQCFSGKTLPCWGNHVDLSGAGFAEGAVNTGNVQDPIVSPTITLTPGLFGEAAINLTAAGVFPAGTCAAFGSAFVKSRSSTSFTAEIKDFIAPVPVNISNCGTINIHKVTENGNATFAYTTTGGLTPSTFNLMGGGTQSYTGDVQAGTYSVTESTPPTGWTLKSLSCTASGSGTSTSTSSATASITMGAGGVVDCTYTNHINLSPTIATTLSATSPVLVGATVHDSATLTGATANAGGTVTYTVYTDSACTMNATPAGTEMVTNGSVPDSSTITFNTAGTYYWQAAYSGDGNNNSAKSDCTSEQLVVNPRSPTLTTSLSASSTAVGAMVHDSSTLTGATTNAGGTVTYTFYTDNLCTKNAMPAGTETVTSGSVPDSSTITFNTAGTYYWQAVYSGDTNNKGATSACTSEVLVVNPNTTSIGTGQSLLPNDSATVMGATPTAGGTITFDLFAPSDATCSGMPAYAQVVNATNNGMGTLTGSTNNSMFLASTPGTWRWKVTYSGDTNNLGSTSACGVESFTIN